MLLGKLWKKGSEMGEEEEPRGLMGRVAEFLKEPHRYQLLLHKGGYLDVVDSLAQKKLTHFVFGVPSLDPHTTLEVLVAVRRYLDKGDFGQASDRKVEELARKVLDEERGDAFFAHQRSRRLAGAFQEAIVHYVREHRLKQALLIEQEMIAQWERPLSASQLFQECPYLHFSIGQRGVFSSLELEEGEKKERRLERVCAALSHHFEEKLPESLQELAASAQFEKSRSFRMMKALASPLVHAFTRHLEGTLQAVEGWEGEVALVHGSSGASLDHHGIGVEWQLLWEASCGKLAFFFEGRAVLSFSQDMERCLGVELELRAPEFGAAFPSSLSGEINEALQEHFPFRY